MRRPALVLTAPLLALALGLAACSGDDTAAPTSSGGVATGAGASGALASGGTGDAAVAAQSAAGGVPRQATDTAPAALQRQVRVSATGSVSAAPDTLTLNIGVRTQADTANGALREAAAKADAVITTLTDAGVAEDDITTVDVSVWPRYDNRGEQVTGYEATNSVLAKVRDITKAGEVIDAAAAAAGDSITLGGLSFSIDDPTAVYAQARQQAVQRAKEQADQLAAAAGVSVGQVISIDEQAQYTPSPLAYAGDVAAAEGGASTPIQPGQTTITLTVAVVYELVG
jgi:uncharacterized protein